MRVNIESRIDKWNSNKVWLLKRSRCGHYFIGQQVGYVRYGFQRVSKAHYQSIVSNSFPNIPGGGRSDQTVLPWFNDMKRDNQDAKYRKDLSLVSYRKGLEVIVFDTDTLANDLRFRGYREEEISLILSAVHTGKGAIHGLSSGK